MNLSMGIHSEVNRPLNALDEMRMEAAMMTDADVAIIMEMAIRAMQKNRWDLLRKRMISPADDKETAYVYALNQYVKAKLDLRRAEYRHMYGNRDELERARVRWRAEMDRIEFNLSPSVTDELMCRLSFLRVSNDTAGVQIQVPDRYLTGPYFRPEIDSPYFAKGSSAEGVVLKDPVTIGTSSQVVAAFVTPSRFNDTPGEAPAIKGRKVKPLSSAKVIKTTDTTPVSLRYDGWKTP